MTPFTTAKLHSLRASLSAHPDQDILRSYFKGSSSSPLSAAVLVTLHRKWTSHPPYRLLSIGITTYTRLDTPDTPPPSPGPHAEHLLRELWCLHLVLRPTAHIDSTPTDMGLPPFHFGTTVYVSASEALDMLHAIWHQPVDPDDAKAGFRPVLYMVFGSNDSVAKIRRPAFDFDPQSFDTTVATLDAQIIPQQAKITRHADANFSYLLSQFKIKPFDEANAGNCAVYAAVVAVLSCLRVELYASSRNVVAKPARTGLSSVKEAAEVMQGMMEWPTPPPPWGTSVFCVRCGSWEHGFEACEWEGVGCERCEVSAVGWRRENAWTHLGTVCGFR